MSDADRARRRYQGTPKPASETDEGKERAKAYRLALGGFVDAFAKVETAMYLALRWHTKTTTTVAKAVFSGTRVETAASFLKRLAEIGSIDAAEWAELEPILGQLHKINGTRNIILHHGAEGVEEGRAFVTDALRALTEDRMKVVPISPEILDAMGFDCRKIFLHLVTRHLGRPPLRGYHAELDEVLHAAWRYIPVPPRQSPEAGKSRTPRT
jgi:hypothetical protein